MFQRIEDFGCTYNLALVMDLASFNPGLLRLIEKTPFLDGLAFVFSDYQSIQDIYLER